ncbi:hypothetical protein [Tritonibacter mobilis]|uniref:hypothetical protein n=1 Tax=Tritonibacter mobilis TaxID=379347 RepID=UPI003A5BBCD0
MWYRTGTLALTNGSATVTGVGTDWISLHQGWILFTEQSPDPLEVKRVVSATELELALPHAGATASGLSYAIVPTHGLSEDLRRAVSDLLDHLSSPAAFLDYDTWLQQPGNAGKTFEQYQVEFVGPPGQSAYQVWLSQPGNAGKTETQFLDEISAQAVSATDQARIDAQAAQGAAETAQTQAEAAKAGAESSAAQVASDRAAVAQIFDTFDDRYLGAKASDPATDNDGDPLLVGSVYWNTTVGESRFWNGAAWEAPSASAATSAQQAVDAQLAALAAQAAAETARDNAQSAAIAAAGSATDAQSAQGGAETARTAAEAALGSVQTIETNVAGMRDQTTAARDAAVVARAAAETARDDTQQALAAAQNDLGLQPVATSGDYNDLINKPKIINPIAIAIALGS